MSPSRIDSAVVAATRHLGDFDEILAAVDSWLRDDRERVRRDL